MGFSLNINKLGGYDFYRQILKSAKYIVAPMVDQSEHAWRLLSLRHGAHLCYSPMLHSRLFQEQNNLEYRNEMFTTSAEDRPLIVQFCANDPDILLRAAQLVEDKCDAVDLNLGCPQGIAKRGRYGAFLQDDWELVYKLVNKLHLHLRVPVTCKIRVFADVKKTVDYAKMLELAGCQLLTVHGRLRQQKGHNTGLADWDQIKAVKQNLNIPVFANGNILYFEDAERCLEHTGVDGIMSAEGNLYNPALFENRFPPIWEMAEEYLNICKEHTTGFSMIRGHLFKLFKPCLNNYPDIRDMLSKAYTFEDFSRITMSLKEQLLPLQQIELFDPKNIPTDAQGYKILPSWVCQPYIRPLPPVETSLAKSTFEIGAVDETSLEDALDIETKKAEQTIKRLERKQLKLKRKADSASRQAENVREGKKNLRILCKNCSNVASDRCSTSLCKVCCMATLIQNREEATVAGLDWHDPSNLCMTPPQVSVEETSSDDLAARSSSYGRLRLNELIVYCPTHAKLPLSLRQSAPLDSDVV